MPIPYLKLAEALVLSTTCDSLIPILGVLKEKHRNWLELKPMDDAVSDASIGCDQLAHDKPEYVELVYKRGVAPKITDFEALFGKYVTLPASSPDEPHIIRFLFEASHKRAVILLTLTDAPGSSEALVKRVVLRREAN